MKTIHTILGDSKYIISLHFSAEGSRLISGGMGGHLKLWNSQTWEILKVVSGHEKSVNVMTLNGDEDRLATGSSDCDVCIWSFPEFKMLHRLRDRKQVVSAMTRSNAGKYFAIGSYAGRVSVWDFAGQLYGGFKAQAKNLSTVAFSLDDTNLLAGGLGGEITSWNLPVGDKLGAMEAHEVAVTFCRFLPGGNQILTLGYEGTLKLWDASNWTLVRSQTLDERRITGFRYDGKGRRALVLTHGKVSIFSLETWLFEDELAIESHVLQCGAFSPDGNSVLVASADGLMRVLALS